MTVYFRGNRVVSKQQTNYSGCIPREKSSLNCFAHSLLALNYHKLRDWCVAGLEKSQPPAWGLSFPGFSARKSDCKTRAENHTNKILELYPNSCSSPSRSPDSLGSDGCCNTKFKVCPPAAKTRPMGQRKSSCSLNGSRKQNSLPPPNCLLCVKLSLCL